MQEEQRKMFKETMERERQREEREKLRYEASIHVEDVRSCFLHTFLDRSSISQFLHHISFLLVNLGFTMPIKLY